MNFDDIKCEPLTAETFDKLYANMVKDMNAPFKPNMILVHPKDYDAVVSWFNDHK